MVAELAALRRKSRFAWNLTGVMARWSSAGIIQFVIEKSHSLCYSVRMNRFPCSRHTPCAVPPTFRTSAPGANPMEMLANCSGCGPPASRKHRETPIEPPFAPSKTPDLCNVKLMCAPRTTRSLHTTNCLLPTAYYFCPPATPRRCQNLAHNPRAFSRKINFVHMNRDPRFRDTIRLRATP